MAPQAARRPQAAAVVVASHAGAAGAVPQGHQEALAAAGPSEAAAASWALLRVHAGPAGSLQAVAVEVPDAREQVARAVVQLLHLLDQAGRCCCLGQVLLLHLAVGLRLDAAPGAGAGVQRAVSQQQMAVLVGLHRPAAPADRQRSCYELAESHLRPQTPTLVRNRPWMDHCSLLMVAIQEIGCMGRAATHGQSARRLLGGPPACCRNCQ